MAHKYIANAVLRDLAQNIRSDHGMPIGKAQRFLNGLYEADAALTSRQQAVVDGAARANDCTDYVVECQQLRETVGALRKEIDAVRKQLAAERSGGPKPINPNKPPKAASPTLKSATN